jgi:hypothetical protein
VVITCEAADDERIDVGRDDETPPPTALLLVTDAEVTDAGVTDAGVAGVNGAGGAPGNPVVR